MNKKTVADKIAAKFGGQVPMAEAIGITQSTIAQWNRRSGGIVPARHQQKILDAAKERGLDVTPADFFELREAS